MYVSNDAAETKLDIEPVDIMTITNVAAPRNQSRCSPLELKQLFEKVGERLHAAVQNEHRRMEVSSAKLCIRTVVVQSIQDRGPVGRLHGNAYDYSMLFYQRISGMLATGMHREPAMIEIWGSSSGYLRRPFHSSDKLQLT